MGDSAWLQQKFTITGENDNIVITSRIKTKNVKPHCLTIPKA